MAKFKTYAERMKHPQAKLIPASMWSDNQLFYESLDENVLSIMKAKKNEGVIPLLKRLLPRLNDQWKKKQAWLGIALTQADSLAILQEAASILKLNENTVFSLLSILGNLDLLKTYTEQYENHVVLAMIRDDEYYPYRKAAENGHSSVLKYFEATATKLTLEMVTSDHFASYKNAAKNGHVHTLKDIEAVVPDLVLEMIQAQNYYAYRMGAMNGHLGVLKHLESKAPGFVNEMVAEDNFFAYRKSLERGHFDISNWLLANNSHCLAYAEAHMHEYGECSVNPFIEQRLAALHKDALNVPSHGVFDIHSPEQANICFYIVRNLIRRNDRALDDEIHFLLSIPSVKALTHTAVTPNQPNELVRLALTTGNQAATSILLNIPEVRALTEENDFYRAEMLGQLDLERLSQDRESSMTALTQGEQKRLDAAINTYGPALKKSGTGKLMNALREQLKERYVANPAYIIDSEGNKIILPMDFTAFQKIKLNKENYQLALNAYYKHKDHTAWRYIAKPNPWMHPDAEFVYMDRRTSAKWSTFEEYQPLIVMLWLAASDKTMAPTDGHTFESRLDHFVDELSQIGRSHNWDKTRVNLKSKVEEYDDMEGDRPSCFSGVKRRLFQSVLGHPLITILTEDMILEEIRNFARDHFQSCIKEDLIEALKAAFNDYIVNINDIGTFNKDILLALNIPEQKLYEFERILSKKYGAQYTEDFGFIKLVHNKLFLCPDKDDFFSSCHALMLDGSVGLFEMLNMLGVDSEVDAQVTSNLVKVSERGFFQHKQDEENATPQVVLRT